MDTKQAHETQAYLATRGIKGMFVCKNNEPHVRYSDERGRSDTTPEPITCAAEYIARQTVIKAYRSRPLDPAAYASDGSKMALMERREVEAAYRGGIGNVDFEDVVLERVRKVVGNFLHDDGKMCSLAGSVAITTYYLATAVNLGSDGHPYERLCRESYEEYEEMGGPGGRAEFWRLLSRVAMACGWPNTAWRAEKEHERFV